ncbi:dual specificity mitogen-activated protein kinase kinase sek-1-like isoform X2 [Paramacrobiotus metropolitanus]|uniref:dual specificity mitogen-activated protein kinase kinase sek-1-like isoform X2 n=1 Tax=Paramacrobiotus metropolitanus TaxID=2943436 RepID=UPI002445830C|nr:dual specificity mitogen-activated protein kinase kinase sek-1-like isoform X2 [Paramacrobiotus metropolitanus]XP_055352418.1 dual specificity mitogen-activated protein kinase kinase sek-1-like isoform X2 [Paramacrobiotus metropolitanus]
MFYPKSVAIWEMAENLVSKRVKGVTFSYPESLDQAVPQMQSDERVSQAASQTTMQFHPDGPAYNVSAVDLEFLGHLDKGQYGSVNKYRHAASGYVMAVKVIKLTDDPEKMKCLRKDLEVNSDIRQRYGKCPYLVHSFGDLFWEGELWICMELMDTCLEKFYKSVFRLNQRLPEDVIAYIAYAVVHGLTFLKEDLDIMHRDVKPSNILVSRNGGIKLCDFGISAKLVNSLAKTHIGHDLYMPPERVNPNSPTDEKRYDIRSDVWSVGITLVEIATGKQPFENGSLFSRISQIVEGEAPNLPKESPYSDDLRSFIASCCKKDVNERPKYADLLAMTFLNEGRKPCDISVYVQSILGPPSEPTA